MSDHDEQPVAYVISAIEGITDEATVMRYAELTGPAIERFGGHFIVSSAEAMVVLIRRSAMPKYILSYRSAKEFDTLADPSALPAWGSFLDEVIAPHVVDPGWPVFESPVVIGEAGRSTRLGGYSIVTANDMEAAVSMAKRCPALGRGGGVEVGLLAELPEEHPAEQMRSPLSQT